MKNDPCEWIRTILTHQRDYFNSNQTKNIAFRIAQLKKLRSAIFQFESKITDALWTDLHKSYEESYLTEINIVVRELDYHIHSLQKWSGHYKVKTPLILWPSSSKIMYEPLGVSLIIAPWNYPFQLLINPLIGAISAGCCCILKPSPYTPHVVKVMEELIKATFQENYIAIVQGGKEINQILLEQKFDIIFFTGSPALGKVVMKAAAEHLTPVILELGGKSPCIVDKSADLNTASKRIAWGKTFNAGQTCIAPDYLLVHEDVKEALIQHLIKNMEEMFGKEMLKSKYYPRIVHQPAFERLIKLLQHGRIRFGGQVDASERFIAPTIIDEIQPDFPIMQEEIFGPILPILTFSKIEEAIDFINKREKPLALYYFGTNDQSREVLSKTSSGGGCVNDTLLHIGNHHLPFGGVGNSGLGKYHGKDSFLAFSNQRAIVTSPTWIELPFKAAPFRFFRFIKRII